MQASLRGETEGGFILLRTLIVLTVMLVCVSAMLSSFASVMKRTADTRADAERIIAEQNLRTKHALR